MLWSHNPPPQGLFNPAHERDSCGVGFVASIDGAASHQIVQQAVQCVCNVTHRGAVSADAKTGDGAGITTQIPHQVAVAVPRGTKQSRLKFPPIRLFRFSAPMHKAGIEIHRVDGVEVRVYNAAKTVADCFRFRNRIGIDVAVEAFRLLHVRKKASMRELLKYTRLCRVERVMMPYIEALQ